jgi:hypothetical protein
MAHDGRWTVGWCKQSTCGRLDNGKLAGDDTRGAEQRGDWGKTAPTGEPRLPVTVARETGGRPARA